MGWAVAALLLLPGFQATAADALLTSEPVVAVPFVVEGAEPANFDLIDLREEERREAHAIPDTAPHSMFGIKRHVGLAAGYDNQVVHGSVGLYLTVAEWGRWNFGVPSPEFGVGRYSVFDARRKQYYPTTDYTIIISLASLHNRAGRIPSLNLNWYVTVEQVFDVRANMPGSQIGISLSSK
jgi:hypothetical protein